MDAPLEFTSEEGYAAASEYSLFDGLESLEGLLSSQDSSFIEDLCNESSQANLGAAGAAQSNCKLQPRVHSRTPSLTRFYTPPPSRHVVQLQSLPADHPLFQHNTTNIVMVPPPSCPTLHMADAVDPIRPDVSAFTKPPPASRFCPNSYEFDVLYCKGKPLPKADPFPSGFSYEEAKHKDMLPYHHALHDRPQLTSPNRSTLQMSMRSGRPPALDVSTNPAACGAMSGGIAFPACGAMSGGIASPAYMQRNIFSPAAGASLDSAAMEMSTMSAPAALPTSNASLFWTSTPPENGSLTVPASPTPSVNKGASTRRIRTCRSATSGVAFKVKTTLLNLHDNFTWKKYGEKGIIGSKFTRSYFKCDEQTRRGCKVVKRAQKCDDEEHILFTYLGGRHNHP